MNASKMDEEENANDCFDLATEFVRVNSKRFPTDLLLKLYGRYKQAKEGPCNTPKPRFYDLQGKQKWEAWKGLGAMSTDKAMQEYVSLVSKANPEWQAKVHTKSESESSEKSVQGGGGGGLSLGVAVSTMANNEEVIDDELKTIFDWCKEGDVKKVSKLLQASREDVNRKDAEGMVLLHWACDRGDMPMVQAVLKNGATVDAQDADGQTSLHYAVSCEHVDVVKLLLDSGAKSIIADCDGQTVLDLIQDASDEIKDMVKNYPAR